MVPHPEKARGIKSEIYSQVTKWAVLTFVEERAQAILP